MSPETTAKIFGILDAAGGKTALYAKNLVTGETVSRRAGESFLAASVIKLAVLSECFARMESGELSPNQTFTIRKEDKFPSCGALTYMHDGLTVTLEDLYTLMIILSDNTATNLLIDLLGIDCINRRMEALDCAGFRLNRRLFDSEASARGLENYIVPEDVGKLLEGMYAGTVVSREASAKMLDILAKQRLNGKIPVLLPHGTKVAHKTGEDDGITHDAGIVFGKQPFVCVLCGNEVETGPFERGMQEIARTLYDEWQ